MPDRPCCRGSRVAAAGRGKASLLIIIVVVVVVVDLLSFISHRERWRWMTPSSQVQRAEPTGSDEHPALVHCCAVAGSHRAATPALDRRECVLCQVACLATELLLRSNSR